MVKLPGGSEDAPSIYLTCPLSDGCCSFWKDLAPMCIHVHVDNVGRFLETVRDLRGLDEWLNVPSARGWNDFKNLVGVLADGKIERFV